MYKQIRNGKKYIKKIVNGNILWAIIAAGVRYEGEIS